MAKVIPLNRSEASVLLSELSVKCQDKKITDLIVMARDGDGNTISHWFGHDSSFKCLGMAHYMADRISGYIEEE